MKVSQSEFHTVRGLRYHVRTWGAAHLPRLFLLHGWMDVSASFQFLVNALEREWHVIAPDWRGFGLTEWCSNGYWFPDYYADLDVLLDVFQADAPVHLIGHSMGGNIACTYAGLRPARIAKLVTLEGLGMPRTDPEAAPTRIVEWLDAQRAAPRFKSYTSFDEVAQRLKSNNPRLTDDKAQFLARHWARRRDHAGPSESAAAGRVEMLSDPRHKARNPYLFQVDEALACWRRITAPTLLVSGKNSHAVAWLRDRPEQLAARKDAFRDLCDVELEDCGHMMHHDQPKVLAGLIERFMAS